MSWTSGPILAFDTETDGPDPDRARIISATCIELDGPDHSPRKWIREVHTYLVQPEHDIPAGASAVHGITTEHAREHGAPREAALFEVMTIVCHALVRGYPIVAFNAPFDFTVLDREARRLDIGSFDQRSDKPVAPVIDPFVMDKAADRYRRGSRKLVDVAGHYGVKHLGAHEATADALAAAGVAVAVVAKYPKLDVDPLVLHGWQVGWKRTQAESLQEYLRREKDPDAVCSPDFPVQVLPEGWDPAAHHVDESSEAAA